LSAWQSRTRAPRRGASESRTSKACELDASSILRAPAARTTSRSRACEHQFTSAHTPTVSPASGWARETTPGVVRIKSRSCGGSPSSSEATSAGRNDALTKIFPPLTAKTSCTGKAASDATLAADAGESTTRSTSRGSSTRTCTVVSSPSKRSATWRVSSSTSQPVVRKYVSSSRSSSARDRARSPRPPVPLDCRLCGAPTRGGGEMLGSIAPQQAHTSARGLDEVSRYVAGFDERELRCFAPLLHSFLPRRRRPSLELAVCKTLESRKIGKRS
jgi:hypothetical protein